MTQVRAILRAAASADDQSASSVRILFPMVTTCEELRRLRAFVRRAQQQLNSESLPTGRVEFGMMLEVPAAAIMIDQLLPLVDFVSIGSNDLVQYLMAADRDNPKVSHLCQPLSPAVIRTLKSVVELCNASEKPVSLCGEMAGQPEAFVLLLGMGLKCFSMSPAFVPTIKELALHITLQKSQELLEHVSQLKTVRKIQNYLRDQLREIAPELSPILMQS